MSDELVLGEPDSLDGTWPKEMQKLRDRLASAEKALKDAIAYEDAVLEVEPDTYREDRFREKSFEKARKHFASIEGEK